MMIGLALAWSAIVAGIWLGWQLLRQNGRMLLRLEELERRPAKLELGQPTEPAGLPVGSAAPDFELPDLAGETQSLAQCQSRGQPLLLIFFNPACGFCRELAPKLQAKLERGERKTEIGTGDCASANGGSPEPLRLLLVSTGTAEENRELFEPHPLACLVLLQKQTETATAYRANGTPSGYLIDGEGKVASKLAMGGEALLELIGGAAASGTGEAGTRREGDGRESRFRSGSLARSQIKRDGLTAGTSAPDFRLPRVDGRGELSLSDFRGRRVLLVFSSPRCGPCQELGPHLEKFHRAHPELKVVMISKGDPKENRAKVIEHGLTFPVVLQEQWEISRRYAMFATPMAYLINEESVIIHDVAVGAEAVMNLARLSLNNPPNRLGRARDWAQLLRRRGSGIRAAAAGTINSDWSRGRHPEIAGIHPIKQH